MTIDDIDIVEINEAFAAQIVPCRDDLGIPEDKLNPFGGAIALGHPFGMTGARIMTTLLNGLDAIDGRYGIESMCVRAAWAGDARRAAELTMTAPADSGGFRAWIDRAPGGGPTLHVAGTWTLPTRVTPPRSYPRSRAAPATRAMRPTPRTGRTSACASTSSRPTDLSPRSSPTSRSRGPPRRTAGTRRSRSTGSRPRSRWRPRREGRQEEAPRDRARHVTCRPPTITLRPVDRPAAPATDMKRRAGRPPRYPARTPQVQRR